MDGATLDSVKTGILVVIVILLLPYVNSKNQWTSQDISE